MTQKTTTLLLWIVALAFFGAAVSYTILKDDQSEASDEVVTTYGTKLDCPTQTVSKLLDTSGSINDSPGDENTYQDALEVYMGQSDNGNDANTIEYEEFDVSAIYISQTDESTKKIESAYNALHKAGDKVRGETIIGLIGDTWYVISEEQCFLDDVGEDEESPKN